MNRNTILAAVAAVLFAAPARAHDLRAQLDPATDPIRVEAWFDDDTPAQNARVSVVRSTGEEVAAGVTDERGRWSFPKPAPGLYRVAVEAVGHRDVIRFTIAGAEDSAAPPRVEADARLDKNLGLVVGLVLLLGGSLAFLRLRSKRIRVVAGPHDPRGESATAR